MQSTAARPLGPLRPQLDPVGKAFTPGIVLSACIPFAFNTLLVISSLQTGYSFYLDETGLYHRGQGYLILVLADLFYLVGASLLVALYRD